VGWLQCNRQASYLQLLHGSVQGDNSVNVHQECPALRSAVDPPVKCSIIQALLICDASGAAVVITAIPCPQVRTEVLGAAAALDSEERWTVDKVGQGVITSLLCFHPLCTAL